MLNFMNSIPVFPQFLPLCLEMEQELHPLLKNSCQGISEFSFPSLLIHQEKYQYEISNFNNRYYILKGNQHNASFFSILGAIPSKKEIQAIFDYFGANYFWKNMDKAQYESLASFLETQGFSILEDRNNEDYLYERQTLAELKGKALHKKKTHVNNFEKNYQFSVKPLTKDRVSQAKAILQQWETDYQSEDSTDYAICLKALDLIEKDYFCGFILYAENIPCAFALGEIINNNTTFCVHFEKALIEYKGVYQKMNQVTAECLDVSIRYINREQDLGLEGLRKAKLSYKPLCFIQKFAVTLPKQIETE